MRKLLFILIAIFLFQLLTVSQPCLPEGITFTTQEQVDSFQINYPNCTEIDGNVLIEGNEIINLEGLSVLTAVDGYL